MQKNYLDAGVKGAYADSFSAASLWAFWNSLSTYWKSLASLASVIFLLAWSLKKEEKIWDQTSQRIHSLVFVSVGFFTGFWEFLSYWNILKIIYLNSPFSHLIQKVISYIITRNPVRKGHLQSTFDFLSYVNKNKPTSPWSKFQWSPTMHKEQTKFVAQALKKCYTPQALKFSSFAL